MDFSNMNCLTLILAKWKIIIDEQGKWRPKYQVSSENCYYVGADFSLHLVHQGKRKKRNRKCRRKKDEHGNEPKNRGIMFTSCQRFYLLFIIHLNACIYLKQVVVERIKNNVIGDKIDPKAVLNLDPGLGVLDAFFASLSMILVSEIGDETFIIAALMAMHHPKSIVLSGALSALFVMTLLSTGLGRIVPNLISRKHTNSVATVLYAFFGLCLLYIAWRSDSKASQKKEMEQVEEKLESGQVKTAARRN
ncbi:GDT1-like protein 3 [Lactuca sativa]|uniref:GDT1-like protein 3 n=1 Tax=Lactuca sativa TaxID=4236 RepID=UPI0022B05A1E|nr:GDT1-like protein 3 [Lactuca sativa]